MSNICSIKVGTPPRGMTPGKSAVFTPSEAVVTWSWGLQPATALIDWVSATAQPAIVAGSSIEINLGGNIFYGLTDNLVARTASDGYSVMQEFRDNREFLMWDVIYAAFNLHDSRIIGGRYQKRYKHLLPGDFNSNTYSFTDTPYTAAQILAFCFGAATVESPWAWTFQNQAAGIMANPVFDLDYTSGQKLGTVLVDISEKLGLVFTLAGGPYRLVWALKGVGVLPGFPVNSDNRRAGSALSSNPTRVRILGDRNRYQLFNVALVPDWLPGWQAFWDFGLFVDDIFLNEVTDAPLTAGSAASAVPAGTPYADIPGDDNSVIGYQLAGARARLLTVAQYADLRDARAAGSGAAFRDYRRCQGRSRLNLPVSLYLSQLLFRAFKLPDDFSFRSAGRSRVGRYGYDLDSKPVVEVTHNPVTGWLEPQQDGSGNFLVPSSEHNGYAIVQGYQVAQDGFGTLNPDYFDYHSWISAQKLWQYQSFQIDDSGEGTQFVQFDQPVINSGDLIQEAANRLPTGQPLATLKAMPTFTVPPVKAAVTLLGEKFSYVAGTGCRDDVANLSGLNGEYLILRPGNPPAEQPFADGLTATQKAAAQAALLLQGQFYYQNGGYVVQDGVDGQGLSETVDRVTLRWNARDGLTKDVDFTNERSRNVAVNGQGTATLQLEPERAFDRRSQLDPLFPGQEQLRAEARQMRLTAAVLRANPKMQQTLVDTFHLIMGLDAPPTTVLFDTAAGGTPAPVPVGMPLFREAAGQVALWPDGIKTLTAPVFLGISTMDGEANTAGVRVTQTGAGGVVLARVRLTATDQPKVGDSVGLGQDKIVRATLELSPSQVVGTLLDDWSQNAADRAVLTRVRLCVATSGGFVIRGEYDPTTIYALNDVVVITFGENAGTYVRITSAGTVNQPPWAGNNFWMQLPMGTGSGTWM